MPLAQGEIQIGTVVLQPEPFEWPKNNWEILELRITDEMGWATLHRSVLNVLLGYYNNSFGRVERGLTGNHVQYVQGYVSATVTVTDWRGNTGQFVFVPDEFEYEEIAGSNGYYTARIRLLKVS